jgi:hypothetical protein
MTDNKGTHASIWPTVWRWTLILGAFKAVYNLALWMTGLVNATGVSILGIAVSITLVVFALKSYRTLNNGYLTFGQGFGIGYVASVLSAAIGSAAQAIYLGTIGAEQLAAQHDAVMRQMGDTPGMDPQALEMISGLLGAIFTPAGLLISGTCSAAIGWLIVAPIIAAIVKKPPPIAG